MSSTAKAKETLERARAVRLRRAAAREAAMAPANVPEPAPAPGAVKTTQKALPGRGIARTKSVQERVASLMEMPQHDFERLRRQSSRAPLVGDLTVPSATMGDNISTAELARRKMAEMALVRPQVQLAPAPLPAYTAQPSASTAADVDRSDFLQRLRKRFPASPPRQRQSPPTADAYSAPVGSTRDVTSRGGQLFSNKSNGLVGAGATGSSSVPKPTRSRPGAGAMTKQERLGATGNPPATDWKAKYESVKKERDALSAEVTKLMGHMEWLMPENDALRAENFSLRQRLGMPNDRPVRPRIGASPSGGTANVDNDDE